LQIYIDLISKCIDWVGRSFWSGATSNVVVVEADAFKERDVIFRALSSRGHHDDMLQTAELVCFCVNTSLLLYYHPLLLQNPTFYMKHAYSNNVHIQNKL